MMLGSEGIRIEMDLDHNGVVVIGEKHIAWLDSK